MTRPGEHARGNELARIENKIVQAAPDNPTFTKRVYLGGAVSASSLARPDKVPVAIDPDSACATAFRLLARQVEHLPNARRIAVSSPSAGEGKTFCALNLCLALVAGGARSVLLVEANLQNPTLSEWIGFTPPRCFADWLLNASEAPEAPFRAVEVCYPGCHVLAVDPHTPKPAGLLGLNFEIASRQLCFSDYQYIIVDTPAVFGSADTALIADSVDGVILCAAKGRTSKSRFREAAKQLEPVPILGKVLTDVTDKSANG